MKLKLLILSLFSSLIFVTISAATPQAQMAKNDSTVPFNSVASDLETTVERTTIVALREISQARSDIHHKKRSSAQLHLAEAAQLIKTIEDNLSTATAKNLIQIALKHLEYDRAKQVLHDLPPIYYSLETVSFYLPTDKAKLHIDKATAYLEKDRKFDAEKELVLADKSLTENELELPLLKMQRYVANAQRYLAAKNLSKANIELQAAEQRAMVLYTGINSPLFHAKQNLWLSFRNYSTATRSDIRAHITGAMNNLNKAAAGGRAKDKEEINKLSSELAEIEKKLTGEGKVAESDLKAVWEKSAALVERSAASLSAGLSEEETTLGNEDDLIEAKLHVTYARIYQVTTLDSAKAVKELDIAYTYLQKAANNPLTGRESKKRILEIGNILHALRANAGKSDADVQERYETVIETLNNLNSLEQASEQIQKIQNK